MKSNEELLKQKHEREATRQPSQFLVIGKISPEMFAKILDILPITWYNITDDSLRGDIYEIHFDK